MKIMVNGVMVDATPAQETAISDFQEATIYDQGNYNLAMQQRIDATAQEKGYNDGFACASYFNSSNAQWAAESQAFVPWRDSAFAYGYDYLAKVQSGEITTPSIEDFLSGVPVIVWPQTI